MRVISGNANGPTMSISHCRWDPKSIIW